MKTFRHLIKLCRPSAVGGGRLFVAGMARVPWAAALAMLVCSSSSSFAQDALGSVMQGSFSSGLAAQSTANLPYNIKYGDFKLLARLTLEADWNDNVNGATSGGQHDYIIQPTLQLKGTYPITPANILTLSTEIGYAEYLEHPVYNGLRINAGSRISFDMFIKDVHLNFHDSIQESQDTGSQGAVAGTAFYGGLNNTAGVLGTWNLGKLVLGLGFDESIYVASSRLFDYENNASENPVARAGYKFSPYLTGGLEATASFLDYEDAVLNNSKSYNMGVYAQWKPDAYFQVSLRGGYAIYDFGQTSESTNVFREGPGVASSGPATGVIRTSDLSTWYAGATVTHQVTKAISYGISLTHQVVPGVQSDATEVTSVGPTAGWAITDHLSLHSTLSYDHGRQGLGNISGNVNEAYDWVNGSLSADYAMMTTLVLGLSYRRGMRYSNLEGGSYTQDLISLRLTYSPK